MTTDQPAIPARAVRQARQRNTLAGKIESRIALFGCATLLAGVPAAVLGWTGSTGGSLGPVTLRTMLLVATIVLSAAGTVSIVRALRPSRGEVEGEENAAYFETLRDGESWHDEVPLFLPHKLYDAGGRDDSDAPDAIELRADLVEAGRREADLAEQVRRLQAENERLATRPVSKSPYRPQVSSGQHRTAGRHRVTKGAVQRRQSA